MHRLRMTLLVSLLVGLPTAAQQAESTAPAGLGWLFLLLGLGAIILVGFVMYARDNAQDGEPMG